MRWVVVFWAVLIASDSDAAPVIVLDPGHGGSNLGAFGPEVKIYEKQLTLAVVRQIAHRLRQRFPAARIVLTRDRDRHVPIRKRVRIANEAAADLFVSIHLNACELRNQRGYETYVLTPRLARLETAHIVRMERSAGSDQLAALDEADHLEVDLRHQHLTRRSQRLAQLIQHALSGIFGETRDRGVRQEAMDPLKGLGMPGVLVEVGFLDHAEEGPELAKKAVQRRVGRAIAAAIATFLSEETR